MNDPERRVGAYPHELSGGIAQRVCLALALMYRPRLLIANEPTAGLDARPRIGETAQR
jgi:peptide/nickel transport system permease protein